MYKILIKGMQFKVAALLLGQGMWLKCNTEVLTLVPLIAPAPYWSLSKAPPGLKNKVVLPRQSLS